MVEGLETGWGFSCFIERKGHSLLFDTGWDGEQVLTNAERMGVDLGSVRSIFISHEHWDHMGGLARILAVTRDPTVYVPASISKRLKAEVGSRADLVEVSGPLDLGDGLFSTGEMGTGVKEQSLLIEEEGGLVVITGCAHPGLGNILDLARKRGKLKAVMGGFHGFDRLDTLDDVGRIFPCHCTYHKDVILERFPGKAERCGVGKIIEL